MGIPQGNIAKLYLQIELRDCIRPQILRHLWFWHSSQCSVLNYRTPQSSLLLNYSLSTMPNVILAQSSKDKLEGNVCCNSPLSIPIPVLSIKACLSISRAVTLTIRRSSHLPPVHLVSGRRANVCVSLAPPDREQMGAFWFYL